MEDMNWFMKKAHATYNPPKGGWRTTSCCSRVVGSALAYSLAKDGHHVQVIKSNLTQPDELLQPRRYLKWVELGMYDRVIGIKFL